MLALVAVAVLALSACSAAPEQESPYAAEFAQARNEATTEAAREILADDVITAAEYRQAQEASVECMRDQGITVKINDDGLEFELVGATEDTPQEVLDAMNAEIDAVSQECGRKFDMHLLALYREVQFNPENRDMMQAFADCLVRGGHRDEGYTKDAYIAEVSRYTITPQLQEDGTEIAVEGDLSDQPKPPEMTACEQDPDR